MSNAMLHERTSENILSKSGKRLSPMSKHHYSGAKSLTEQVLREMEREDVVFDYDAWAERNGQLRLRDLANADVDKAKGSLDDMKDMADKWDPNA